MKIALYHNLPSGGAKRTIFETVSRLSRRHQVDLFGPSTADRSFCDVSPFVANSFSFPFRPVQMLRSPLGRLNPLVTLANVVRNEALSRRIANCIDGGEYDVVLVHPCMITQAPSILRFLATPTVYYCHEAFRRLYEPPVSRPWQTERTYRKWLDAVDPLIKACVLTLSRVDHRNLRSSTIILTNSEYTRQNVRRIYHLEAEVNHPGVDGEAFSPVGHCHPGSSVISVGALKPEKGFDFLISAIGTIPNRCRPPLVLVSNAVVEEERAYLRTLARAKGVQLDIHIGVSNDRLAKMYGSAGLMAYAPVREPLGLATLESQACQTPVVGVAEGGVTETVLHNQTGVLVERSSQLFGEVVSSLLSNRELRTRYGAEGRVYVQRDWNWETSTAQLEQALERAAGQKRSSGSTAGGVQAA